MQEEKQPVDNNLIEKTEEVIIVKPQKSDFWIWTTLWLTTFLDSVVFMIAIVMAISLIAQVVKVDIVLYILLLAGRILSLWLGAYVAVKYVLKRTIVRKQDAQKLARLAIVVPLAGSILSYMANTSVYNITDIIISMISVLVTIGAVYYSVNNLISKLGD